MAQEEETTVASEAMAEGQEDPELAAAMTVMTRACQGAAVPRLSLEEMDRAEPRADLFKTASGTEMTVRQAPMV